MSLFTDQYDPTKRFYDVLCKERDSIVKQGGDRVPDSVLQECMDLRYDRRVHNDSGWLKQEIMNRFQPYWQTTTTARAEHRTKLKTSALQSSRLTRLRQRRGLPFKSRRQP